jgi:ferredoxin
MRNENIYKSTGMGSGMNRGCGRRNGGGKGQGMSCGRGGSQVFGKGGGRSPAGFLPQAIEAYGSDKQARELRTKVRAMTNQLSAIKQGITDIAAGRFTPAEPEKNRARNMTALIDQQLCMNCGICIEACPEQAISLNAVMEIDPGKCTGCGSCIQPCPSGAISLKERAMWVAPIRGSK